MSEPLRERVAEVDRALRLSHAGGLELLGVDAAGTATVAMTGMCAGCLTRPICLEASVVPALVGIAGVRAVRAQGGRLSDEALERLEELLR